jgi:alcohol dehydrogenase (cytochrome c)
MARWARLACLWAIGFAAFASMRAQDSVMASVRARADHGFANWTADGGTSASQRFSPLDQINTRNVATLEKIWEARIGGGQPSSTPLVIDGVLYMHLRGYDVMALDAATGQTRWRYTFDAPAVPLAGRGAAPAGLASVTGRGFAAGMGRLFFGTRAGDLIAVDAASGEQQWRQPVREDETFDRTTQKAGAIVAPPVFVKGLVVTGSNGGDAAYRGRLVAVDARDGKERWRFHVVPGPGEKGHETWTGDSWQYGGGAPWMTGSYDPDLDLLYWGTGNASSNFSGGARKGDNLYTASIVALRPETGELVWHFQTTPHDVWDWDAAYETILVDLPVNGRVRKLLVQPNKNGFVYVLDRTNGTFLNAWKYIEHLTWTSGLNEQGVPQNRREPTQGSPIVICPDYWGARSWNQAAFSPTTGLLYNHGAERCAEFTSVPEEPRVGQRFVAGSQKTMPPSSGGPIVGHIDAIDPVTGRRVWQYPLQAPLQAPILATQGNLIITHDPKTAALIALDAQSGEKVWSAPTGSTRGGAISYAVNGRQFIAVPSASPEGAVITAYALPN